MNCDFKVTANPAFRQAPQPSGLVSVTFFENSEPSLLQKSPAPSKSLKHKTKFGNSERVLTVLECEIYRAQEVLGLVCPKRLREENLVTAAAASNRRNRRQVWNTVDNKGQEPEIDQERNDVESLCSRSHFLSCLALTSLSFNLKWVDSAWETSPAHFLLPLLPWTTGHGPKNSRVHWLRFVKPPTRTAASPLIDPEFPQGPGNGKSSKSNFKSRGSCCMSEGLLPGRDSLHW